MNNILLNPGPTNTRETTKLAQYNGSDVCHRTHDFQNILQETKSLLVDRFGNETFNVALLGGSGTVGIEAMISSLVEDNIVVINAGIYGQRAIDIMKVYGINYIEEAVNNVSELQPNEKYTHVYFVENETTTGEHFPLKEMSTLYPNAKFFIDSTSAFGASDYDGFYNKILGLSFCSNKCLQSTPGLGIIIWNKDLQYKQRSYYCNLERYMDSNLPFTLPVQSVYALNTTLKLTGNQDELFDNRKTKLIQAFDKIGINCLNYLPSNSIIGFQHPKMSYTQLQEYMYQRGIVIYSGIEGYENSFRVSTMSVVFDTSFDIIIGAFNDSCLC